MRRVNAANHFYHVGGAMHSNTPSYVQRKADLELLERVLAGDFCYVLTPRQIGKSSLMMHTATQLKKSRIHSVVIDLQGKIDRGMAPEAFYAGLVDECIRQLDLPINLELWWREHASLGAVQRFSNFIADEVLGRVQKRLVVFIDEIDSTLNLNFSDDFFAAIRALYNQRARNASFNRITVVMLGVAALQDLIKDRARSPFNIGRRIELTDFTLAEAGALAAGLPLDKTAAALCLARVFDWTGGHPYLTQIVCATLATDAQSHRDQRNVDHLIEQLFFSDATWTDPNLANTRDRLVEDKDYSDALLELYRRILAGELVRDDERSQVHVRLKLSGIVKVFPGGVLRPRNRIYKQLFDLAWVDTVFHSDKLHQAIAALEAQQRDLGLDFTQQFA
jgi:AAA-like domain